MSPELQLVLIFIAILTGVISASYFYTSTNIFLNLLKRPLKLISSGMFVISIGVLLGAYVSYEANYGLTVSFFNIPVAVYFYVLYIVGSIMIAFGARQFTHRPLKA